MTGADRERASEQTTDEDRNGADDADATRSNGRGADPLPKGGSGSALRLVSWRLCESSAVCSNVLRPLRSLTLAVSRLLRSGYESSRHMRCRGQ